MAFFSTAYLHGNIPACVGHKYLSKMLACCDTNVGRAILDVGLRLSYAPMPVALPAKIVGNVIAIKNNENMLLFAADSLSFLDNIRIYMVIYRELLCMGKGWCKWNRLLLLAF